MNLQTALNDYQTFARYISLLKIVIWYLLKERGIIDFSISMGNQRFHAGNTSNNMHIFSIKS